MSYCAAIQGLESDSLILIDACLARVRADARLDEEPVLPPLESILPDRLIVRPQTENLPSADAIVKSVWSQRPAAPAAGDSVEVPAAPPLSSSTTQRRTRATSAPRRWPVLLCGFLAGISGGVALMKSPLGRQPTVQHSVQHSVTFMKREALHVYASVTVAGGELLGK